jgi:hypothetical protein
MKTKELQLHGGTDLVKITRTQFVQDYKIPAVQKLCRNVNTPAQVFNTNLPTIGTVKKVYGDDFAQAYIETWIVNISEFVNIGKNMNENQIYETAQMILDSYPYFTLADINLIFKKAKKGDFGQIYDRLDGQIIFSWFTKYNQLRCLEAEEQSISQANYFKERDNRPHDRDTMSISNIKSRLFKK